MADEFLLKLEENIKEREQYTKTNWNVLIFLSVITLGVYGIYILFKKYNQVIAYSKKQHEFFTYTSDYLKYNINNQMADDLNELYVNNFSNEDVISINSDKKLRDFFTVIYERLKCKIDNTILINYNNLVNKYYCMVYQKNIYNYKISKYLLFLSIILVISVCFFSIGFIFLFSIRIFIKNIFMIHYYFTIIFTVLSIGLIFFIYYAYVSFARIRKSWAIIQITENKIYSLINDALIKQNIIKEPLLNTSFNYNINNNAYFMLFLCSMIIFIYLPAKILYSISLFLLLR